MTDDGTSIGIWVGPDDEGLVDEFDATCNSGAGTYSRSEHVKRAMRAYIGLVRGLEMVGRTPADVDRVMDLVRWAVVDHFRD